MDLGISIPLTRCRSFLGIVFQNATNCLPLLIHNSARNPVLAECSVEIHSRDILDLPGPDVFKLVVSRQVCKNS
ncbi:uncharacterized protein LACBIDRAFT_301680 [Laccaria bicolor S238N-H82]|uniref:Predicted protein n=1 Tax=Laccaria bicolor (strain S238N-H82 / ATCC MYA-4686) TaxID=486041 RepID=B0CP17_LACBS|nr:uncharacterized protein LACBIDRAFT_301680 [Laccaria bicolor S238N-H82]EDR16031.1 predicted protein [Laccaria bicolor S238N-H82]|eukprot:XP_001874239.1 predicted protein [Laccaria bicolor S238N-H82]